MPFDDVDRKDIALALGIEEGLTDWEIRFLDSINVRVHAGDTLTDNQREKLNEILQEHDR